MTVHRPVQVTRTPCGHAMVSALVGVLLTATGGVAVTAWTAQLLLAERHQAQQSAVIRWLQDRLEIDCGAVMQSRTESLDLAGTRVAVSTDRLHLPQGGDPMTGHRLSWRVRWTDPWGHTQERRLVGYCVDRPRAY